MIDIRWLLPKTITIEVWDNRYYSDLEDWVYKLHTTVNDKVDVDEVKIYIEDELLDVIEKHIILQPWDVLNLEYKIDVCEISEQNLW